MIGGRGGYNYGGSFVIESDIKFDQFSEISIPELDAMISKLDIKKGSVMSRFWFSISPVQVRELTLYALLRPTPHIVIPVLGLSPQKNYQGWGSRKRIYLLRKRSIYYKRKIIKSQDYEQ